jgi:hypothetical protein
VDMATTEVFRLRLDSESKKKAQKLAKLEQRTLASLIRLLLDQYIAGRTA